ncbi:hypothetical protein K438DRAFT_1787527 [Mycena galopus ATCC 62051]|nr:hypothetical protein K438DRAFT_1787527 [Mycena galopus ATCC 62051]
MPPITVSLEENTAAQLLELLQSAPPSMHPVYAALRSSLSAATSSTLSGTGVSAGRRGPATSLASTVHAAEPAPLATRQRLLFDAVTTLAPKRAQSLPPIGSSSPRKFERILPPLPTVPLPQKAVLYPLPLATVVEDQEMLFVPSSSEVLSVCTGLSPVPSTPPLPLEVEQPPSSAPPATPTLSSPVSSTVSPSSRATAKQRAACTSASQESSSALKLPSPRTRETDKSAQSKPKKKCAQLDYGKRIGGDKDIGLVDSPVGEDELSEANKGNSSAKGKKQKGKKNAVHSHHGYTTSGGGPPLTKDAGTLVTATVGSIFSREKRAELDTLLETLGAPVDDVDFTKPPKDIAEVHQRLNLLEKENRKTAFWYMVSLVQLALHVHSAREDAVKKHLKFPSYVSLAETYSISSRWTFQRQIESGTHLLSLCAASSPYILVLIAALDMKEQFCSKSKVPKRDIMALATAFREFSHDKWGTLINRLRIPLEHIKHNYTFLATFKFRYNEPQPQGARPIAKQIPFGSQVHTEEIFGSVSTKYVSLLPVYPTKPMLTALLNYCYAQTPGIHTQRKPGWKPADVNYKVDGPLVDPGSSWIRVEREPENQLNFPVVLGYFFAQQGGILPA